MKRDFSYFVYRYGSAALRRLPGFVSQLLMRRVATIAYRFSPDARQIVTDNLRHVLGPEATPERITQVVRASFVSYGEYWTDLARLSSVTADDLREVFYDVELAEFVQDLGGRGAIFALPHLGSWEIAGLWAHYHGFHIRTVAEPASTEALTKWFEGQRRAIGITAYAYADGIISKLLSDLERGDVVALVADRDVIGDGVIVTFFGGETRMPGGPALLALRSGKPLYPIAVIRDSAGKHRPLLLSPLDTTRQGRLREDVQRITQDLAAAFETLIQRAPEQWHVFQPVWVKRNYGTD